MTVSRLKHGYMDAPPLPGAPGYVFVVRPSIEKEGHLYCALWKTDQQYGLTPTNCHLYVHNTEARRMPVEELTGKLLALLVSMELMGVIHTPLEELNP